MRAAKTDQTWRTPRLIWVFIGRTGHFVDFVVLWLIYSKPCPRTAQFGHEIKNCADPLHCGDDDEVKTCCASLSMSYPSLLCCISKISCVIISHSYVSFLHHFICNINIEGKNGTSFFFCRKSILFQYKTDGILHVTVLWRICYNVFFPCELKTTSLRITVQQASSPSCGKFQSKPLNCQRFLLF